MEMRSFSSFAMTGLLTWRNPQGGEENWYQGEGRVQYSTFGPKLLVTELAILPLLGIAAIESVVVGALALIATLFSPLCDPPRKFFATWLISSLTSAVWLMALGLGANFEFINVHTTELFAFHMGSIKPEHKLAFGAWALEHGIVTRKMLEEGTLEEGIYHFQFEFIDECPGRHVRSGAEYPRIVFCAAEKSKVEVILNHLYYEIM